MIPQHLIDKLTLPAEILAELESGADLAISVSGGKDGDAMATLLPELHRQRGWTGRIVLVQSDLGRTEWEYTEEHLTKLSERTGVELMRIKREKGDMVDRWRERYEKLKAEGKNTPFWSSSASRYCTSDMKRGPIDIMLRHWTPTGSVICAVGLRRQESMSRAKKDDWYERDAVTSVTKERHGATWHPLMGLSLNDVWEALGTSAETLKNLQNIIAKHRKAGITPEQAMKEAIHFCELGSWPAHPAYLLGNERLSCKICILGSLNDIANGIEHDPAHYRDLVDLEIESGFSFKQGMWLGALRPDLLRDDQKQWFIEKGLVV